MARKGYIHPSQRSGPYTPTRGVFAGQTFSSYRGYQNAHAKAKGFGSAAKRLAKPQRIGRKAGMKALTRPSRLRALDAVSRMLKGLTIGQAAHDSGTTVATVKRYASPALRKDRSGRIVAKERDQLAAYMEVPTTGGTQLLLVIGARSRHLLSAYWEAAQFFRDFGIPEVLAPFESLTINVEGVEIPLITDPHVLTRLFKEGRMSFESLYAKGLK
jgi:hypothetical protein